MMSDEEIYSPEELRAFHLVGEFLGWFTVRNERSTFSRTPIYNRLIVLWLTLYDRAISVSTSPASRRAIASRR
jgi:hypothetical protein